MNALRVLIFAVPFFSLPVLAEEEGQEPHATAEEKHEHQEAWQEYPHFFTGFGGATMAMHPGEHGEEHLEAVATFGIDYSYRFSEYFAVGAYFDYAAGFHELLVGPCIFFFPWRGLFLEASPSLQVDFNEELSFAVRMALGYEFELTDQFLLGLYAAVDYGHERFAFVPGITVGYGF